MSSDSSLTANQVAAHLEREFDGMFDRADIRSCAIAAISDLNGSICAEALHEMAYKLASYRLRSRLEHTANPTPTASSGPHAVEGRGGEREHQGRDQRNGPDRTGQSPVLTPASRH
jgi:hypothetical protein